MSDPAPDSVLSPSVPAAGPIAIPPPPNDGWSQKKFFFILVFVIALHFAFILLFSTSKKILPRPVGNVPHWQLAGSANELIALGDPTLFARPNIHDFVTTYWRRMKSAPQPGYDWPQAAGYFTNPPAHLGALFEDSVQHAPGPHFALDFKPQSLPPVPLTPWPGAIPRTTTLQISGELARRQLLTTNLLTPGNLPSIMINDVIAPTRIQTLVGPEGNVEGYVVLESSGDSEADQQALRLVRNLRFATGSGLVFGAITFIWHTVPVPDQTNH